MVGSETSQRGARPDVMLVGMVTEARVEKSSIECLDQQGDVRSFGRESEKKSRLRALITTLRTGFRDSRRRGKRVDDDDD